jgi:hypothetical protein
MNKSKHLLETQNQTSCLGVVRHSIYTYAVTGTFHGSIIEAVSEGEARRIFHKHYNGESITHVRKHGKLPGWAF